MVFQSDAKALQNQIYQSTVKSFWGERDRYGVTTPGFVQRSQSELVLPVHIDWENYPPDGPKIMLYRVLADFAFGIKMQIEPKGDKGIDDISLSAFTRVEGYSIDSELLDFATFAFPPLQAFKMIGVDVLGDIVEDIGQATIYKEFGSNKFNVDFLKPANLESLNDLAKSNLFDLGDVFANKLRVESVSGFKSDNKSFIARKSSRVDIPFTFVHTGVACRISDGLRRLELARSEQVSGSELTYTVVKGDTLERISENYLGQKIFFPEIVFRNQIKDPDLIKPGQILTIPSGKSAMSKQAVNVQLGDTLSSIWKTHFSTAMQFSKFKKRNSSPGSGQLIHPGMMVYAE